MTEPGRHGADAVTERGPGFLPAWDGPIIDCDVHANVASIETLLPYMGPLWEQWVGERRWAGPRSLAVTYPPNAPSTARSEWRPADGRVPASDVTLLQQHVLDPLNVERAIVNCYYAVDAVRHPDLASALASAINDWLLEEWLSRDSRLRASIVLPARDPAAMRAEIERVGGHPGFVQVLFPVRSDRLYGNRIFSPVYEAACELDLVIGLHWGGTPEGAPSPTGWPSWYVEEYAAEWQVYVAQLTSLIAEGTFQRFPSLRVAICEGGFTWFPIWGWRMNKEWRGLRRDVPWIAEPPSQLVREHVRFSVAPADCGTAMPEHLAMLVRWMESDEMLMYATDYPHSHDDDAVTALLEAMPTPMRPKLMADNARTWYRL